MTAITGLIRRYAGSATDFARAGLLLESGRDRGTLIL